MLKLIICTSACLCLGHCILVAVYIGVVCRSLCLGCCVQVTVFRSLYLGYCVQVTVFRLLCFGHCLRVTGFGSLCLDRLHSGFSNHRDLHEAVFTHALEICLQADRDTESNPSRSTSFPAVLLCVSAENPRTRVKCHLLSQRQIPLTLPGE